MPPTSADGLVAFVRRYRPLRIAGTVPSDTTPGTPRCAGMRTRNDRRGNPARVVNHQEVEVSVMLANEAPELVREQTDRT